SVEQPASTRIYPLSLHDALPICPGSRIAQCKPPSTRLPVPCAIELVPIIPRSWPVAAKMAAIAEAGVNATDCMPEATAPCVPARSEEHTSELQSRGHLVCRLLLE